MIDDDIYFGAGGMSAERNIVKVISVLKSQPLTKGQLLEKQISEEDLHDAFKQQFVSEWSLFLNEPLYYVEDTQSELLVERTVEKRMAAMHLDDIVMETIKNRKFFNSKFNSMLACLQSFDRSKLKMWNPLTFYEMLSWLYENGRLKETDLAPLLDVVEESKKMPVDEIDLTLADAKKLVGLNLLTLVDKETGLYRYGFCSWLEDTFRKKNIDYMILTNGEFDKLSKVQTRFLKELDIIDEKGLTKHGEVVMSYLCQCGFDPKNRDEELEKIITKLEKQADEATPSKAAKYLLRVARIQNKMKNPAYEEKLISAAKKFSEGIADSTTFEKAAVDAVDDFVTLYCRVTGKPVPKTDAILQSLAHQFSTQGAHGLSGMLYYRSAKGQDTFQLLTNKLNTLKHDDHKVTVVIAWSDQLLDQISKYQNAAEELAKQGKLYAASKAAYNSKFLTDRTYKILEEAFKKAKEQKSDEAVSLERIISAVVTREELEALGNKADPSPAQLDKSHAEEKAGVEYERAVLTKEQQMYMKELKAGGVYKINEILDIRELKARIDKSELSKLGYSKVKFFETEEYPAKRYPELDKIKGTVHRYALQLGLTDYTRDNAFPEFNELDAKLNDYFKNLNLGPQETENIGKIIELREEIDDCTSELAWLGNRYRYERDKIDKTHAGAKEILRTMNYLNGILTEPLTHFIT